MRLKFKKLNFTETIPSKIEDISNIISSIMEKLYHLPLDEHDIFNVKLGLQEAVVNAITHGNKFNVELMVKVHIRVEKDYLICEVTDEGQGFDVKNLPDPTHDDNLSKLAGRGVFLIHSLMDKIEYTNRGRTIKMIKYLKKGRRGKVDINTEKINDVTIVTLDGEINVNNAMDLRETFEKITAQQAPKVSVDFANVTFIDSSGLAVLIELVQNLQSHDGKLRLCHVNSKIKGIFEITKIHKLIDIYDTKELALEDF